MEGVTRYTLVDIFSVGLISVSVCVTIYSACCASLLHCFALWSDSSPRRNSQHPVNVFQTFLRAFKVQKSITP